MSYRYMDAIARLVIIVGLTIAALVVSERKSSSVRVSTLAAGHVAPTAATAVAPTDSVRHVEAR